MPIVDRRPRGRQIGEKLGRNLKAIGGAIAASYTPELENAQPTISGINVDESGNRISPDIIQRPDSYDQAVEMMSNNGQKLTTTYPTVRRPSALINMMSGGQAGQEASRLNMQSRLAQIEASERRGLSQFEAQQRRNNLEYELQQSNENAKELERLRHTNSISENSYQSLLRSNEAHRASLVAEQQAKLGQRLTVGQAKGIPYTDDETYNQHMRLLASPDVVDPMVRRGISDDLTATAKGGLDRTKFGLEEEGITLNRPTLLNTMGLKAQTDEVMQRGEFQNAPLFNAAKAAEYETAPSLLRNRATSSRYLPIQSGLLDMTTGKIIEPLARPSAWMNRSQTVENPDEEEELIPGVVGKKKKPTSSSAPSILRRPTY